MKKRIITLTFILVLLVITATVAFAGGAIKGEGVDPPHATLFGTIEYLFTPAGYHMWFTAGANQYGYTTGHDYHVVYQFQVDDPAEWTYMPSIRYYGPNIPNIYQGLSIYYKVIDKTAGDT